MLGLAAAAAIEDCSSVNHTAPVENIGPRQRSQRRLFGAWALALGTGAILAMWALGSPPWVRLVVSPVFLAGFLGVFQAREST